MIDILVASLDGYLRAGYLILIMGLLALVAYSDN